MTINKTKNKKLTEDKKASKNTKKEKMSVDGNQKSKLERKKIRLCIWAFLKRFLFLQLIVAFLFLIIFVIERFLNFSILGLISAVNLLPWLVVGDVILVLYDIFVWQSTYYVLRQDSSVVYHKNLIFKKIEQFYTLNRNADFKLRKSLMQRIFGCGTIRIVGPTIEGAIYLRSINNPEEVLSILETISKINESDTLIVAQ